MICVTYDWSKNQVVSFRGTPSASLKRYHNYDEYANQHCKSLASSTSSSSGVCALVYLVEQIRKTPPATTQTQTFQQNPVATGMYATGPTMDPTTEGQMRPGMQL